jgi:hypothetical protein
MKSCRKMEWKAVESSLQRGEDGEQQGVRTQSDYSEYDTLRTGMKVNAPLTNPCRNAMHLLQQGLITALDIAHLRL